jgi:hypothetical protein
VFHQIFGYVRHCQGMVIAMGYVVALIEVARPDEQAIRAI